jgi:molybdenum cofactor biosynthesis protein A
MPQHGIEWLERKELMTYEEMLQLCSLMVKMGVDKIRITGGEPFVRKGIMSFFEELVKIKGLQQVNITTNGVLTAPYVSELKKLGINSINLSLDTLDRDRFFAITRRDELPQVLETLDQLLVHNMEVKLNTVVMEGKNIEDIIPLIQLTKDKPVSIRFIEEMPFNGEGHEYSGLKWNHFHILNHIKQNFSNIQKVADPPHSTSYNYYIPGHKGTVGIIAAYSRSFCGTCNRIRVTPDGLLKTCLYDGGVMNVKDLMRDGFSDDMIQSAITQAMQRRAKDGWEAERKHSNKTSLHQSMATIGG